MNAALTGSKGELAERVGVTHHSSPLPLHTYLHFLFRRAPADNNNNDVTTPTDYSQTTTPNTLRLPEPREFVLGLLVVSGRVVGHDSLVHVAELEGRADGILHEARADDLIPDSLQL